MFEDEGLGESSKTVKKLQICGPKSGRGGRQAQQGQVHTGSDTSRWTLDSYRRGASHLRTCLGTSPSVWGERFITALATWAQPRGLGEGADHQSQLTNPNQLPQARNSG